MSLLEVYQEIGEKQANPPGLAFHQDTLLLVTKLVCKSAC